MSTDYFEAATTALYYANEWKDSDNSAAVHVQALTEAQVNATLAVAHEQRTANLIAFHATCTARGALPNEDDRAMKKLEEQIKSRLGLDS